MVHNIYVNLLKKLTHHLSLHLLLKLCDVWALYPIIAYSSLGVASPRWASFPCFSKSPQYLYKCIPYLKVSESIRTCETNGTIGF